MSWIEALIDIMLLSGFRGWGHEMNKDTSPIEPGLMPFVRMNKKVEIRNVSMFTQACS